MPIKRNSGFTIIEILVSVVIMSIIALGLMSMQTSFSQSLTSRQISSALTDVSNSQMARC
ncbi:MAG: type II secretion system protein, partial [Candidatus Sericytochromatia bacterium]|nr:type II secretion system protein [Candidatus Sericytochromatia bacterium]